MSCVFPSLKILCLCVQWKTLCPLPPLEDFMPFSSSMSTKFLLVCGSKVTNGEGKGRGGEKGREGGAGRAGDNA